MKILLINVPCSIDERLEERGMLGAVRNTIPPLGLAYIAAVAEREGHEVRIVDEIRVEGRESIRNAARDFRPVSAKEQERHNRERHGIRMKGHRRDSYALQTCSKT